MRHWSLINVRLTVPLSLNQHVIQCVNTSWLSGVLCWRCEQPVALWCDSDFDPNESSAPCFQSTAVEKFAGFSSCDAPVDDWTALAHREHRVQRTSVSVFSTAPQYRRLGTKALSQMYAMHQAFWLLSIGHGAKWPWIRWLSSGFMTWDLNKVPEWLSSALIRVYSLYWRKASSLRARWGSALKSFAGFCLWRIRTAGIFPLQSITVCLFSVCECVGTPQAFTAISGDFALSLRWWSVSF